MTVSTDLNRKQYAGNGVTTSFATSPVVFFDSTDLDVYVVTTATGAATLLTETTDYTVTGGAGSTGTVSTAGLYGAPSASQTLVIVRNVPLTQAADFVQNDASDAEVVEDALDKLTMADQQLSARLTRSFTLADSDVSGASLTVPTPAAGTLVGWNDDGTELQNYEVGDLDLFTVSTPWAAVIDDASIAAGMETMVTALTADTAPAVDDYVFVRSTANTQGRKTTWQNALKVINGLTVDSTPDSAADYVVTYDASVSAAKKVLLGSVSNGAYRSMQVYTASGANTWTKPSGLKRIEVTVVGGGGGGGGCAATAGGEYAASGGGGGGGYSVKVIEAANLGSTETATVGAGGTAGDAGANSGNSGGTSSFGAHCSATGGGGGSSGTNAGSGNRIGGAGGAGSGGDINGTGNAATSAHWYSGGSIIIGSTGGGSLLGGGGLYNSNDQAASAGGAYGGGASGVAIASSQSARAGAAGAAGIIIVKEFF